MGKQKYKVTFGRYGATGRMFHESKEFSSKKAAKKFASKLKRLYRNPRVKKAK